MGDTPNPATIQKRIDALLITYQYAPPPQKPPIENRIKALQTALEYAA